VKNLTFTFTLSLHKPKKKYMKRIRKRREKVELNSEL